MHTARLKEIAFDAGADGKAFRLPPISSPVLSTASRIVNAISVDVEDYFQVEALKSVIARQDWEACEARVIPSTERVLALMEATSVRGTFFTLGWIAQRFPQLVRAIAAHGHEVASHGSNHERADLQSPSEFRKDVGDAKALLEDIAGCAVRGYRAPTFSIGHKNWWAYDVLAEAGYAYSSSVYPITHDLYGMPDAPRTPFYPTGGEILEIPMSTVRLGNLNLPCSGGGYFRLLPYAISRWSMRRVNAVEQRPVSFYCHPWEFDADQPRFKELGAKSRFRHYTNLSAMPRRFSRLLRDFAWDRMDRVFLKHLEA